MKQKLGATGEFPQGKIDETDEGELQIAICYDPHADIIRIDFGKPVSWLGLDVGTTEALLIALKDALSRQYEAHQR